MTECFFNCPAQGYQSLQSTILKSRMRHTELNSKTVLAPAGKRSKQAAAACGELIRVSIHMLTCQSSSLWSKSMLHPGCSLTHNLTQAKSLSGHNAMPFCLTRDDPKAAGVIGRRLALLLQPCRHVIQPLQAAPYYIFVAAGAIVVVHVILLATGVGATILVTA